VKRAVAVLFGLLLAAETLAQGQQALGKWWKRPRIAQELQLTAEQETELEKVFARSKPRLIDLRADLEKKQFDYEQAMQGEKVDRKAVEARIEAREQARAQLQKELSLMELDMKQVLNPEQRERLMRLRDEGRQRMQERRRNFRDGGSDGTPPPKGARQRPAEPSPSEKP
jgi:Spy/CpxP family protein refolding chaperone